MVANPRNYFSHAADQASDEGRVKNWFSLCQVLELLFQVVGNVVPLFVGHILPFIRPKVGRRKGAGPDRPRPVFRIYGRRPSFEAIAVQSPPTQ